MIIFNLYAIAVGLIIAVIVGPIYWIMPDEFANSPLGILILTSLATIIAGIAEAGDLKGRLFFLPMWVLGLIGTIVYAFMQFSWKGIGMLVGVVALIIALFVLVIYLIDKSDWKNAFNHLLELKKMKNTADKNFWEQVEKSKFFPTIMNYTHSICAHNLEVINYMKSIGVEWEEIDALIPVFKEGSVQGNEINVETELTDAFEARMNEELALFEEK